MTQEQIATLLNVLLIGISLVALGTMIYKGALRERVLALGPTRDLGLSRSEYVVAVNGVCGYVALMLLMGLTGSRSGEDEGPGTVQSMLGLIAFFLSLTLIGLMVGRAMNAEAGFRKIGLMPRHPKRDLLWVLAAVPLALCFAWSAGLVMIKLSTLLNLAIDPGGHETLKALRENNDPQFILNALLSAGLIAPLLEELLFRGVLQTSLLRLLGERRWVAILITAALFSVTHLPVVPWQNLVPLFVLGLVFGYLYERTGSMLTPILSHAGFNLVNLITVITTSPTTG